MYLQHPNQGIYNFQHQVRFPWGASHLSVSPAVSWYHTVYTPPYLPFWLNIMSVSFIYIVCTSDSFFLLLCNVEKIRENFEMVPKILLLVQRKIRCCLAHPRGYLILCGLYTFHRLGYKNNSVWFFQKTVLV